MHDIKQLRADPEGFDLALKRRHLPLQAAEILALDQKKRDLLNVLQQKQSARNNLALQIAEARRQGLPTAELEAEGAILRAEIEQGNKEAAREEALLKERLETLPNRLADEVPEGEDETKNRIMTVVGEIPQFAFPVKEHFELGEALGLMDFEKAAKLSGSRFVVLKGALAGLERALGQFMIDLHTQKHGYTEISPPGLVLRQTLYGTCQLPKFAEDCFSTTDDYWLIPTAEVPLTNMVAEEMVPERDLPYRFTALTDCYRSEAGSAGRDTRGMLRQHQFKKVEMVSVVHPDKSEEEHERMTAAAEEVLTLLGLPYRKVLLCAGDTGFSAAKTYDLEVYLPGQKTYREISSCSNCRDFQARRMNARFRGQLSNKSEGFVHTLNGSGVAVGRALIAVIENYQQADGSIKIPEVLQPYMNGQTEIKAL